MNLLATPFPPLPLGEGRGEGFGQHKPDEAASFKKAPLAPKWLLVGQAERGR